MATFSSPDRPVAEIITVLSEMGVATLKPEHLSHPTADLVRSLYANLIFYVDSAGDDPEGQISFAALELLENPDHHADSIRAINLYRRVKDFLSSIRFDSFTLRDFVKPDEKQTIKILSNVINFLYHREDKLNMLQPTMDKFPAYEDRRVVLDTKISELTKEMLEHEVSRQLDEPIVQEVDAEVKELRQTIQNYNKQQVSLKTMATGLKEKIDVMNEKISKADFELVKNAQENSKLLSDIVQSPDKLQSALEEKKSNRTVVKNSERLAMQSVQEKTATLEVYSKASDKIFKHLSLVHAMQEQVTSAKNAEKDVKSLKAKLSDEGVSNMILEAKIVEHQGKAKKVEELVRATERERDMRHAESTERLNNVRAETERMLNSLEDRERKVEAMVAKGERVCSEADSVREAGKLKQHQLQVKHEDIASRFGDYSNNVSSCLQMIPVE